MAAIISRKPSPETTRPRRRRKTAKALEAYNAAYARYRKDRTALLDWVALNGRAKDQAKQNFADTDYALNYTAKRIRAA